MKCYLIAKKLSHSFSKPIHNALADYSYDYKEIDESELAEFFEKRDFDGLNVTIPYKELAYSLCDELDGFALEAKSVNTVIWENGKIHGYNTDVFGFISMVEREVLSRQSRSAAG